VGLALAHGSYVAGCRSDFMTWLSALLASLALLALTGLAYWQLIVAEGTYLGPRFVAWTYDLVARRYDGMKRFESRDESWFIARPLLQTLAGVSHPLVLDVATGTGRLPLALFKEGFDGEIVGLDLSSGMLQRARSKLASYEDQLWLIWQDASLLPFADGSFDAVVCLESLEFLPRPLDALAEMVRVLAPGGALLVTNRVGYEAKLLPGRALPQRLFAQALASHSLYEVRVRPWQENYDLALARKEGGLDQDRTGGKDILSLLRCPACGGQLKCSTSNLSCQDCRRSYPVRHQVLRLADSGNWTV
jgi:ubiquinone/menaquinone biosynthesis C-methylase UbiE